MHKEIGPAIQYWGTPVVLVSTLNEDGSVNVAPMSSAWWLGWSCMLGFDASSHTVRNLRRENECVLNLASVDNLDAVNRLAMTTGARTVPVHKRVLGYHFEPNKLGTAALSTLPASAIRTPRIAECAVQLEAVVESVRPFGKADPCMALPACAVEVRIVRVHADDSLLRADDKIDPDRWRPLIMSFRELFALGVRAPSSRLASGDEELYAPWKQGPIMRAAVKVLGVVAGYRYGVREPQDEANDIDA